MVDVRDVRPMSMADFEVNIYDQSRHTTYSSGAKCLNDNGDMITDKQKHSFIGTADVPPLCLSPHEKVATHFTIVKGWFVDHYVTTVADINAAPVQCSSSILLINFSFHYIYLTNHT